MATQSNWNLIFLIYADLRIISKTAGSISKKFEAMNAMLRKLPVHKQCNLFVIDNTITLNNAKDKIICNDEFACYQYVDGVPTLFYEKIAVDGIPQKPGVIAGFLKNIGNDFPAEKTILFTWDHGSVFGIDKFTKDPSPDLVDSSGSDINIFSNSGFYINPLLFRESTSFTENTYLKGILEKIKNPYKFISDFIGSSLPLSFDQEIEPVIDILTNEMLNEAIEQGGFKDGKKMDIVCMMNCCMQNLHAQFALQKSVNILVAPVTWIYYPGYDYKGIFKYLNDHPDMNATELSEYIIETVRVDAARKVPKVSEIHSEAIYAIKLENTFSIAGWLKNNIANEWKEAMNDITHKYWLKTLISDNNYIEFEQLSIPNYRLIDLYQYFVFRTSRLYSDQQKLICKNIYSLFNLDVESKMIGKQIRKINNHNITGIVLSVPDRETYYDPNEVFIKLYYKTNAYQSALVRYLEIDKFLEFIYTFN